MTLNNFQWSSERAKRVGGK